MSALTSFLYKLNLFDENDATDNQHRSNLYATRIFLALLIVILVGFTLGFWLITFTTEIVINNPTIDQYEQLSHRAKCPCSQLVIPYGAFVELEASLHSICSSDFISERWIETISSTVDIVHAYRADFRVTGGAQFLALAAFCRLSNRITADSISSFGATSLLSRQALTRDVVEFTVESSIRQFQLAMPSVFQSHLRLINQLIFGNKLISGLETTVNAMIYLFPTDDVPFLPYLINYYDRNITACECHNNYNCRSPSLILNGFANSSYWPLLMEASNVRMMIPGFYTGCLPINSLLQSSLECFYNQTCVDQLASLVSVGQHFSAIRLQEHSVFQRDSTVQYVVDLIMVENWRRNFSYQDYFHQCKPVYCTYFVNERRTAIVVLTQIIGVLGGLTLVLTLIIPKIVHFVRNRHLRNQGPSAPCNLRRFLFQSFTLMKQAIVKSNLFKNQSRDARNHRYQIIASRLYIGILIVCMITITLYQGIRQELHQQIIENPTLSQYIELSTDDVHSLVCPCTNISVPRREFISLEPIYHDVCSSFYVSPDWIEYLDLMFTYQALTDFPYRVNLAPSFRLLKTLCDHAQETVNITLKLFLATDFVSSVVVQQNIFLIQFDTLIKVWQFSTVNRFELETKVIQAIQQGNKYLNEFYNFKYQINQSNGEITMVPLEYSNCSCDLSQWCHTPSPIGLVDVNGAKYYVNFTIDSFYVGCSIFESLTQSTLQCVYNQTCLDAIRLHLNSTLSYSLKPKPELVAMNNTSRWPNATTETIQSILDQLMIVEWLSNVSFARYYQSCAPTSCTLEYRARQETFVTLVTVFSVFGGLSTGLKLLILIVVRTAETLGSVNDGAIFRQFFTSIFSCQRRQQIANRIHLVIFLALVCFFYLISFVPSRLLIVSITKPSLPAYGNLLKVYSQSLQCLCSTISFNYETFLSVDYRSHAICSSPFVSDDWILYIYQRDGPFVYFNQTDFRRTAIGQYQLLSLLCALTEKTVQDAILQLNTTAFTDARLISSDDLHRRIQIFFDAFKENAPRTFLTLFNTVREVTETNMLSTLYSSNSRAMSVFPRQFSYLYKEPIVYQACSCVTSTRCTQPSGSMMVGCYPLEALLQSTLQCFYDQQCIDASETFRSLEYSSHLTRYQLNATVESILGELMVEEYLLNVSYGSYFDHCAVSSCSYSYRGRQDTVDIIATIVGLYGGLMVISKWMTAALMRFCSRRPLNISPNIQ